MAGFLSNVPHSFGDKVCQDALIIGLQNSAQLAPKVKTDGKMSEGDLSHSAANFLATVTGLHRAEDNHSCLQKIDTSTVTTASSRGTSQKSVSFRSNRITGLQQLHQLTSVPAATFESLNTSLNLMIIADEDNSPTWPFTKWASPSKPLLPRTDHTCLGPVSFVVKWDTHLQIAHSSKTALKLPQPVGN